MNDDVFEQESQYLAPKERIKLFDKQINELEDIFQSFKTAKIMGDGDEQAFYARLQQSKLHHEREFTELVYDLAEIYKILPEFNDFFKKWVEGKPETEQQKRSKFYALVRMNKLELIRRLLLSMQIFAKTLNNYSMNIDIFWIGIEKMHGKVKATPQLMVKPEQVKKVSAPERRTREHLIQGIPKRTIIERDGISPSHLEANISYYRPKLEKEGILVPKKAIHKA